MCHKSAPHPNAGTRRRIQRLARAVSDLAAGSTAVEELGRRLTEPTDVPAIANALRPAHANFKDISPTPSDPIGHANVSATGLHGGILPAP